MILSLDVRRARKGDCLILHYGTKEDPGLILIDGGPSQVYTPQLKPRLAQIREARNLPADEPLVVNLMMVSHIDDDHIKGILDLTKELITAMDEKKPLPLRIRDLWHNSFDDIIGNDSKELIASVTASLGAAGLHGDIDSEDFDEHTGKVLASVAQGDQLRKDAEKLKLPLNKEFGGELVRAEKEVPLDFGKGLAFTVAGPMKAELIALHKEHDDFLKKQDKKAKTALASFTDTSVANLSSLVLLAEVDTKKILLTGDARGDKILEGLELVKRLTPGGEMHVDILKVPHHGSDRNMETGFFKRVTADHYVFSGDGEHGNPERETLNMLLEARGDANYTVHLTYPVDEIDVGRKADWEKERAKEIARNKLEIREEWDPNEHSVTAFLAANPGFARKFVVVAPDQPHVIDLHDALGY